MIHSNLYTYLLLQAILNQECSTETQMYTVQKPTKEFPLGENSDDPASED